jgi:hypothetical protein
MDNSASIFLKPIDDKEDRILPEKMRSNNRREFLSTGIAAPLLLPHSPIAEKR